MQIERSKGPYFCEHEVIKYNLMIELKKFIVFDTNVVVAGLRSRRGASFQLLKSVLWESQLLKERAKRADLNACRAVLAKVPDNPVDELDRIS